MYVPGHTQTFKTSRKFRQKITKENKKCRNKNLNCYDYKNLFLVKNKEVQPVYLTCQSKGV